MRPSDHHDSEAGFTLLEVLVALAVLAGAGLSLLALCQAALDAERQGRDREVTDLAASRLLGVLAGLPRADLDRRLGRRSAGPFATVVGRPERFLYRVAVEDSATGTERMATVLYRPEAP